MSDPVILAAYHGGLGDSLQFSTLPELFVSSGREVFIWDQADFRNREIYDLVWGLNPYVSGVKSGTRNAGDIPEIQFQNLTGNGISNWEVLHGLPAKNSYPKIYYTPKIITELREKCVVDLSSVSMKHETAEIVDQFTNLKNRELFDSVAVQFRSRPAVNHTAHNVLCDSSITVDSIFHYCDIIASCKQFVSLHSGQSHLASAIKNQYNSEMEIFCILRESEYIHHKNKGTFIFENVKYCTH